MENHILLVIFMLGLCSLFGLADLCIYVYQKYTEKKANHQYWSAYQRN